MKSCNVSVISSQIQNKRFEMLHFAELYGLTNQLTLRSSQELDQLMNQYHAMYQYSKEVRRLVNEMIVIAQPPFARNIEHEDYFENAMAYGK